MDVRSLKVGDLVISKIPFHGKIPIGTVREKKNSVCFVKWHHKVKYSLPDLCMPWEIEKYFPEGYEDFQDKIKDRIK